MMRFTKLSSLIVLSAAFGLLSYGCGSSDETDPGPEDPNEMMTDPEDPTVGRMPGLPIHFSPDMYSAFDGRNDYQIPVTVTGVTTTSRAAPPAFAATRSSICLSD